MTMVNREKNDINFGWAQNRGLVKKNALQGREKEDDPMGGMGQGVKDSALY